MTRWSAALLLALATLARPAVAQDSHAALPERCAVIGFDGVDRALVRQVEQGALRGLSAATGAGAHDHTDVPLTDTLQLIGCSGTESSCLIELAALLDADLLVFGNLVPGPTPVVALSVFDARAAQTRVSVRLPLDQPDAAALVAERVRALMMGRAVVTIEAADPGGEVLVDGTSAGRAPVTLELDPGAYDLRVAFDDGRRAEHALRVDAANLVTLELAPAGRVPRNAARASATPNANADQQRSQQPDLQRGNAAAVTGWTAIGLGAASAGLAAMYAGRVRDAEARFEQTPFQARAYAIADEGRADARRTNAFAATGAALLLGGAVTVVVDRIGARRDSALAASCAPTRGGALLSVALQL